MRKKLFMIFVAAFVLISFVLAGCTIDQGEGEVESKDESSSSEQIAETSVQSSEKNVEFVVGDESFQPSSSLIINLQEYLEWQNKEFEPPDTRLERKIQDIVVYGCKPVMVRFDPDHFYYVCAYFGELHCSEKEVYCCNRDYTWVGFYNKESITEAYNGMELVAAFQINVAGRGDSILDDFDEPCFESIDLYYPTFVEGKNTADSMYFDACYLYACVSDQETIYVFSGYLTFFDVISCVEFEDKTYISFYIGWVENADEERIEEVLRVELGEYYDSLRVITETDKYTEVNHWGRTERYALIDLEDFAAFIENARAEISDCK